MSAVVTHLDHVGLQVPDPEVAARFYATALGMVETDRVGDTLLLALRPRAAVTLAHHELALRWGRAPAVEHLAFGVPDVAEVQRAAARLTTAEVEFAAGLDEFTGTPNLRFVDPDGWMIEIAVSGPRRLNPGGQLPFEVVKLGHVTQRSPDPPAQYRFWSQRLGFKLSDHIDDNFFWLRCNRDHHALAFVRADSPGTHHVAIEVAGWEDLKLACDHLRTIGTRIEYGPCRHGPGNNVAIYFRDPFGIRWELFAELERIDGDREPVRWEGGRQQTINLWGPLPEESYYV